MDPYDSDSSGLEDGDYTETGVLLGYASKEPTDDAISHLGGHPSWLDASSPPPASLAKCKVCNDFMSLLLHLNGDLPEHFPDDERRLYILACRRRTCTRKSGSIRAFRSIRRHQSQRQPKASSTVEPQKAPERLGESIFGVKSPSRSTSNANPFSTTPSPNTATNPFSTLPPFSSLAAKAPQPPEDSLPATFAEKARISSPPAELDPQPPPEVWPQESSFPSPYPFYHLDADYETMSRPSTPTSAVPSNAQVSSIDEDDPSSASIKDSFESSLDKPFMRFSTRLAHNPEQVIRYEFKGKPLLYSTSDAVGKLLVPRSGTGVNVSSGIPRCTNCGSARVFEVQLVPHAITMLEEDEQGVGLGEGGMEWGTVILGVCGKDCPERGKEAGEVGYVEEWAGVQWEEQMSKK